MTFNIGLVRHPHYSRDALEWSIWRDTFEGGSYYRDNYLVKFSTRETDAEFTSRRKLTPIPTFAKAAILDVRNSIYQRLVGVSREGGSKVYKDAVAGRSGGVDGQGASMDGFIGDDVLTELLLMGKAGVYIDAAPPEGDTLADATFPPYLTRYAVEDILSFSKAPRGKGGEFQSVLLRDHNVTYQGDLGPGIRLPNGSETGYRLVWKDDSGVVWFKLYDKEGNVRLHPDASLGGAVKTNLRRVPFVLGDIGESLMKDVASYQKSLLNLGSQDVWYALKSNNPFLTIQRDAFATGDHLLGAETAEGGQGRTEDTGGGKGRYFGVNEERPQFIAPPTDPLEASMTLQGRLEDSIRYLINLAVTNKSGSRTESAESKKVSQGGLEAGLSFIGVELESMERKIAQIWAEYENVDNPDYSTVHYPDRYTLKSDQERIDEADSQLKLVEKLPTQELKKVMSKQIVGTLLGGVVPQEQIDEINRKIDSNDYILSDPQTILQAHKSGLVDNLTASDALGFNADKVVPKAKQDRADRIAQTLAAQTPKGEGNQNDGPTNPASRGAPELDTNPNSGSEEKEDDDGSK